MHLDNGEDLVFADLSVIRPAPEIVLSLDRLEVAFDSTFWLSSLLFQNEPAILSAILLPQCLRH